MSSSTATSTDQLLTQEQVRFFDDNGYLVLPGRIGGELLERLRSAGDQWIADGAGKDIAAAAGQDSTEDGNDFAFADRPNGRVMFRVDYLHDKRQAASLELLGSPEILGIAQSLSGDNYVPTYESMVFKNAGDGAPIHWHQDAVHPRKWRIYNVDVYLDDSRAGEGALRVVPGTHRSKADICALEEGHEWDIPGATEVALKAGDVLIHDVMIVHGSPPVTGNALRRTIYYEFRAAEQIDAEGPWGRDWIDARLRLIPLALEAHAEAFPDVPPASWRPDHEWRPAPLDETDLRVLHNGGTPGSYCSAGSVSV